jgi:hypothetical protein
MTPSHFLMTLARRTWRGLQAPSLALGKGNSLPEPKKVDKGCWGRSWNFFGAMNGSIFRKRVNWGVIPENIHSLGPKSGLFGQRAFRNFFRELILTV